MEDKSFNEVIKVLPFKLREVLRFVPENIKTQAYEIRLRLNKPVALFGRFGTVFVKNDSTVSALDYSGAVTVNNTDIKETVSSICGYSLYSHQHDITQGFVTFGNGHRAGFCGTAVYNGSLSALRDIDSVNIRIAREYENCADKLLDAVSGKSFTGIIVAGAPCSGKTTVLRSFASKISSSYSYGFSKTAVIDERYEMGCFNGVNCDVLRGFNKLDGIVHATRVLSPEIIVCDEVTTVQEAEKIVKCCYSGIKFAVSVHTGNIKDIFFRPVSKILIDSGFFDYIVFLKNSAAAGDIDSVYKTEELNIDLFSNDNCNGMLGNGGISDYKKGNQTLP